MARVKALLLALLVAVTGAIKHQSLAAASGEAVATKCSRSPELAKVLQEAKLDDILAEIKHRVVECGGSESPLADLCLDDLFAELKRREHEACVAKALAEAKAAAAAAGAEAAAKAAAEAAAAAAARAAAAAKSNCPDNFMDELVDQANPEFELMDTNKDGCLSGAELSETLRRQIEVAQQRDYYWIRRNITSGARKIIKDWTKEHAIADTDDKGNCVNKEELLDSWEAICDCPTQFMLMDHNADGKISQQEAATYVSAHMVHADLNYLKLAKIFKAADVDGSKYLNSNEFCEAGPRYHGDGKDGAPAPGPAPGGAPGAAPGR